MYRFNNFMPVHINYLKLLKTSPKLLGENTLLYKAENKQKTLEPLIYQGF